MATATAPKTAQKDTSVSVKASNPAALNINASAGPQRMDTKGESQTEYRSMLTSQDTGDQKQAPLPPLPDLPVRGSQNSSNQGPSRPITFTTNPSLSNTNNTSDAKAWVAHSDGRTENISAAPELKSALPAKVERNLSEQGAQATVNKSPLAKDLAQAAKAGQPVAWVAHKDGRLNDIDSEPNLAEAMPAKVSNKLTSSRSKKGSGFFGKVVHGAVQVAKVAVLAGLAAFATDKIHKEYVARKENHGQDEPVKPVSDRGLLGRKV